jgi:hypothetical protein
MTAWISTFRSASHGDCYDRYLVRIEEMRRACASCEQCIEKMPKVGPVSRRRPQGGAARRGEMKRSMEALIHHFKLYTEGYHVPAGRDLHRGRGAQGRVRRLSGGRRHQQALSLQDPRARLPAPAGTGLSCPRDTSSPTCRRTSARSTSCSARSTARRRCDGVPPTPRTSRSRSRFRLHARIHGEGRGSDRALPAGPSAERRAARCSTWRSASTGWLPRAAMNQVARNARYGADPRLRGRDLLHDVQAAPGRHAVPAAGLHHDAVLAARLRRGDARLGIGMGEPTATDVQRGRRSSASAPASTRRSCRSTTISTRTSTRPR